MSNIIPCENRRPSFLFLPKGSLLPKWTHVPPLTPKGPSMFLSLQKSKLETAIYDRFVQVEV